MLELKINNTTLVILRSNNQQFWKWQNSFAFKSQILVLPNGYFKQICIKADIDIGGTELKFDPLLGMIRYWRRHCTIEIIYG